MLLKKIVFVGAVLASCASSLVHAGVGDAVNTVVTPISDAVTYQIVGAGTTQPLTTLVAYKVTITRSGNNTVNTAVFKAQAATLPTSGNANPVYYRVESNASENGGAEVPCQLVAATATVPATVTCPLGTLRAGASRTFGIYFLAPANATNPLKSHGDEDVKLTAWTDYSEAQADASTVNDRSTATVGLVELGTTNPSLVQSALSKQGGKFYTGNNGVALGALERRLATLLVVPETATALFTSATINLVTDRTEACGNFIACHTANITIPDLSFTPPSSGGGATQYLTITIRIDAQDVGSGFRESGVAVFFDSDPNALPRCTFATVGGVLQPELSTSIPRCVGGVFRYGNASALGDFRRDVEITVYSLSNGGYKVLS